MLPSEDNLPYLDDLSQSTGGQSFLVRKSPHAMDTYVTIVQALMTILQLDVSSDGNNFVLHKNEHFSSHQNLSTRGSFRLDPWLGSDTQFGIYVPDTEDHLIKSVQFQDNRGQVYGPYTKMSTSYDLINYKSPNIAGDLPSFLNGVNAGVPEEWKYQIEWFEHRGDPVKSVITVTSRNNYPGERNNVDHDHDADDMVSDTVIVSCWVSHRQWPNSQYQYLQLFARVSGTILEYFFMFIH